MIMATFLKKHWPACAYVALCAALFAWSQVECIGAHDIGMVMCGHVQNLALHWLLVPTVWLMGAAAAAGILDALPGGVLAEEALLAVIVLGNAFLWSIVVRLAAAIVRRVRPPRPPSLPTLP